MVCLVDPLEILAKAWSGLKRLCFRTTGRIAMVWVERPNTADLLFDHLSAVMDAIEWLDNPEREKLIKRVDTYRDLGMWGIPGIEVMIGIHNKCVLECKNADVSWDKFDFFVV